MSLTLSPTHAGPAMPATMLRSVWRRRWRGLLCVLLGAAVAFAAKPLAAAGVAADFDRQLLVMLAAPPAHFQPGATYSGNYQAVPGQAARRRIARALAREHGAAVLDAWPMPALRLECFVLQTDSMQARDAALRALGGDARIAWAQPMQRFDLLHGANAPDRPDRPDRPDPLYATQPAATRWHLQELHAVTRGRAVTIAQIDTGVDLRHPDLRGQIAQARNFVDGAGFPAEAHGTAVAGIIVARDDNGLGIVGIAPRARLLALRACWAQRDGDACSSFTLAQALQFALQAKAGVINLSLGGPPDRLLQALLNVALEQGVAVVAAADPAHADGGFPASHPGVLAVAASETVGVPTHVLRVPGSGIPTTATRGGWDVVSGTSFAAAHVTGLVALLRELSPRLPPARLRDALVPTAAVGLPARRPPSIDACAAVARVSGRCACDCATQAVSAMPRR